jgi:hypothetical protein
MKAGKPAPTLDDIELIPDAMAVTERAIKAAFRTGHVSADKVKRTAATKRRKARLGGGLPNAAMPRWRLADFPGDNPTMAKVASPPQPSRGLVDRWAAVRSSINHVLTKYM